MGPAEQAPFRKTPLDSTERGELLDEGRPLFVQVADHVEASVLEGSLSRDERAPSTTQLAASHRVSLATAARGLSLLVDRGILVKRRGLGMFVTDGARQVLLAQRRQQFVVNFLYPLLQEARVVGLSTESLIQMIRTQLNGKNSLGEAGL